MKTSLLLFYSAEDNKPSFVFTRIIYLEHGSLRVSSFLQDATGGAEKQAFLSYFGIAPNRVYTDGRRCRLPGELLPHLFTVTGFTRRYFLLHCPGGCPRRTLSVILSRWSSDFPQKKPLRFFRDRVSSAPKNHSSSNLCSRLYVFFALSFSLPDLSRLSRRFP